MQGKSPRELYLSDKEEILIAIILVNSHSPYKGDSPREQYVSDKEDDIIVLYQPFYPPSPLQGKFPRELYLPAKVETLITIGIGGW